MNYCSHCSAPVELRIPDGDSLPRFVCGTCNTIHYQNPKIIVGCIPEWNNQILLCRRAIEPKIGLWTIPAGFMENQETLAEAAIRETNEEANANIEIGDLYAVYSLPHISQVYVLYRAKLIDTNFFPGIESQETKLFHEHEIPWGDIAFKVIHDSLKRFIEERRQNSI
ncbi:MAG TPA: NUDIX hydrolase, partial [Nitrosomonas sp.]|nr:NUDIX hydrolase [Nitrosomonas sp.]